jgi:hypothetical protein
MRKRLLYVANVASLEIHGTGVAVSCENCHPPFASHAILPFISILVPVQFAQSSWRTMTCAAAIAFEAWKTFESTKRTSPAFVRCVGCMSIIRKEKFCDDKLPQLFSPLSPQPLRFHLRSLLDVLLQKAGCTILDPAEIKDELRALCEALIASNKHCCAEREETQAVSKAIKWLMAKYPHALRHALDNGFFGSLDEKRRQNTTCS